LSTVWATFTDTTTLEAATIPERKRVGVTASGHIPSSKPTSTISPSIA
jgi:hypothetical protein